METKSLIVVAPQRELSEVNIERFARECARLADNATRLTGPGANAVRVAAQQLVRSLELYEQQRRRLAAEILRGDTE
jgi:hypothetical protein